MIPKHKALKLLAWVDGELGWWSSLRISRWTARDADARALAEELRATRSLLQGNEPARTLPEGRELYWSRIANGILAGEASVVEIAEPRLAANWGRLSWLPAGAMAAGSEGDG